jgi:hypothetical protein
MLGLRINISIFRKKKLGRVRMNPERGGVGGKTLHKAVTTDFQQLPEQ